jgi:hypothetical protein
MHQGMAFYFTILFVTLISDYDLLLKSQVPKAVDAWKADLVAKNKPKIAASIASPSDHAELFKEGWETALASEGKSGVPQAVNGEMAQ